MVGVADDMSKYLIIKQSQVWSKLQNILPARFIAYQ
jgi:hypothetical protein